MFQISPDQSQWYHLYRVQKFSPIMFVLFTCEEINDYGNSCRILDLRIFCNNQETMGGSWRIRDARDHSKQVNRAECTKFLELRAKFAIANATLKGVDEVELVESSREELALAVSLDETLREKLGGISLTLFPRMAREMIASIHLNQSSLEIEDLLDWPTRNVESGLEFLPQVEELAPDPRLERREPLTTKTQRVPL